MLPAGERRSSRQIPRVCAGMAFALTDAVLCLAALAQRLALRL